MKAEAERQDPDVRDNKLEAQILHEDGSFFENEAEVKIQDASINLVAASEIQEESLDDVRGAENNLGEEKHHPQF